MKNQNTTLILFGITGDLARKKIIPAFFELHSKKLLPLNFQIVGFLRKDWDRTEFEKFIIEIIGSNINDSNRIDIEGFLSRFIAFQGDLDDKESFLKLKVFLDDIDNKSNTKSEKIFYLAISPAFYFQTLENLKETECVNKKDDSVLIEKPFGRNLKEAEVLNSTLESFVDAYRVFRVDHYITKDAMEDIFLADFSKNETVQKIEIKIIENYTVGSRGVFYDATGAFLDVGQNHLLQMLATTMTALLSDTALTDSSILKGLHFVNDNFVRGQYEGYRDEAGVNPQSKTETYFKIELKSDEKYFENTSIVLEAGKGFDRLCAEVIIYFKNNLPPLRFDFNNQKNDSLTPYARIIMGAIEKTQTLFVSKEEVLEEWRIAEEIIKSWQGTPLLMYEKGSDYHKINNK